MFQSEFFHEMIRDWFGFLFGYSLSNHQTVAKSASGSDFFQQRFDEQLMLA